MKELPLTNGGVTLVDDSDFEWLSQFLRAATPSQNCWNSRKRSGRNRFKGVVRSRQGNLTKPWRGNISVRGKNLFSPAFATDVEAAEWYDMMALEHHGAFSKTNRALGLLPAVFPHELKVPV